MTEIDLDENPFVVNILQYQLEGGTDCEKYDIPRQSMVTYRCPGDWEELNTMTSRRQFSQEWTPYKVDGIESKIFFARILKVSETRICEYEFLIEATSLCIDPQLIPSFKSMDTNNLIRCHLN